MTRTWSTREGGHRNEELTGKTPRAPKAVARIGLAIALSGTGYAVTVLPRNSVGTAQLKNNAVNSSKVRNRSLKANDFGVGQIPTGRQGPAGAQGPKGDSGEPATRLWAHVVPTTSTGADYTGGAGTVTGARITRGSGALSATRTGVGSYRVTFNQNLGACAYVATVGFDHGFWTEVVSAQVNWRGTTIIPAEQNSVRVYTHRSTGGAFDTAFHLAVFC